MRRRVTPAGGCPTRVGALILAAAAALVTLAISEVTSWGLADARTGAALAAGLLLAGWFISRCRSVPDPVLDLALLSNRRFALVTAVTLLYSAGFFGLLFSFVLFLTSAWHLSIVQAGLAITPMAGIVILLSTRVGALAERVGFRLPLSAGAALIALGLASSSLLDSGRAFESHWIGLVAICGLGIGLCYPLLSAAAVAGLPLGELAAATAVNQCARQLGAALGVAATVAAIGPAVSAPAQRFHLAWLVCAGFAGVAALAALRVREASQPGVRP